MLDTNCLPPRVRPRSEVAGNLSPAKTRGEAVLDISSWMAEAESLRAAGKFGQAEGSYRQVLSRQPQNAAAWHGLGQMAIATGQYEAGASLLSHASRCAPKEAGIYIDLGLCLGHLHRWDLAEQAHCRALRLAPENFIALANLGKALWRLNRVEEAIAMLRAALRLRPDLAFAHATLGLTLLLAGQWKEGWEEYESRLLICPELDGKLNCPKWLGQHAPDETILLCCEQGAGDTIQFLRYVPLVKARVGRVILHCPDHLVRLAQTVAGADAVVPRSQPAPICDRYALLMSLPRIFGTTVESVPGKIPYLRAPPSASAPMVLTSAPNQDLRVGLVWAGNPLNQDDFHRSMPLDRLAPLLATPGVQFFSLQVGPRAADIRMFSGGQTITDGTVGLRDFADTAAALSQLDLLISVDTSVAHLAGALGRPVWVLLAFVPDWRWLMRGETCPWYPTMRLFRQPRSGDWDAIVAQASSALLALTKQR
jgi:tetratricopeptide (TPR) repeat protein